MENFCKYCQQVCSEQICPKCLIIKKKIVEELGAWIWDQYENHVGSYSADRQNEELMYMIDSILKDF